MLNYDVELHELDRLNSLIKVKDNEKMIMSAITNTESLYNRQQAKQRYAKLKEEGTNLKKIINELKEKVLAKEQILNENKADDPCVKKLKHEYEKLHIILLNRQKEKNSKFEEPFKKISKSFILQPVLSNEEDISIDLNITKPMKNKFDKAVINKYDTKQLDIKKKADKNGIRFSTTIDQYNISNLALDSLESIEKELSNLSKTLKRTEDLERNTKPYDSQLPYVETESSVQKIIDDQKQKVPLKSNRSSAEKVIPDLSTFTDDYDNKERRSSYDMLYFDSLKEFQNIRRHFDTLIGNDNEGNIC